jgi:hypothetical protein
MQRPTLAFVVFVSLLGLAGSAKADTIDFSFVSTPNIDGTYVDASGILTGDLTYSTDPADLNAFAVSSGTITVVSNIQPSPFVPGNYPLTPELNGSSDTSYSNGGYVFRSSPAGITVSDMAGQPCNVCFLMPGNPADGGDFTFVIDASGLNGAAGNSEIVASDGGSEGYFYETDGTLTLSGQAGAYDLTPEPPSWLLLGSGVILLGFLFYRRSAAAPQVR